MKKRYLEIDMLRGIAILAMILIHTCYYFLNDKTALFLWNWSQFAVPVFIFCSAYLFFQTPKEISLTYLKKRFFRLIYPYYIFLLFFIPLVFLLTPQKINLKYIIQSIFLIGGTDINWLILLFVYMTIIFPLIITCLNKYKRLFIIYLILSIISACLFIFYKPPLSYKYIMWISWSVIPIFTYYFTQVENKKIYLLWLSFISGVIFAVSYSIEIFIDRPLGMYENKYPPTIYFLSYGAFMTTALYYLSKLIIRNRILTKLFSFFSFYSYSIFFIHYFVLIALSGYLKYLKLNWITFFLSVLLITVIVQMIINFLKKQNKVKTANLAA